MGGFSKNLYATFVLELILKMLVEKSLEGLGRRSRFLGPHYSTSMYCTRKFYMKFK